MGGHTFSKQGSVTIQKFQNRLEKIWPRLFARVILLFIFFQLFYAPCFQVLAYSKKQTVTSTPVEDIRDEEKVNTEQVNIEQTITIEYEVPKFYFDINVPKEIQDYMFDLCKQYNVPVALIVAMMERESRFNSDAVSRTNDYGYMQINKGNFEWLKNTLGISNLLDPEENILCGIYIISSHLKKNNNNINNALMCYNCGAGGAARLWKQGTYSTAYSRAIIERYNYYNAIYENGTKSTRVIKKSSTLIQSK